MVNARTPCGRLPTALSHRALTALPQPGRPADAAPNEATAPENLLAGRDSNPNFQGQNLASCH